MMTTAEMKSALYAWLRFTRKHYLIATEVDYSYFIADLLTYHEGEFIEVEIKQTFADFKKDFEKKSWKSMNKHAVMEDVNILKKNLFVPNKFYFAIQPELETKVIEYLDSVGNKNVGVLVIRPRLQVDIVRNAKTIRDKNEHSFEWVQKKILMRMSSQLGNILQKTPCHTGTLDALDIGNIAIVNGQPDIFSLI